MTTIETPSVIRQLWRSALALGVLTLGLGAVVLIWPGDSIVVASAVFGVYLLVAGIAQAIAAFAVDMSTATRILYFISGALSVVLGYFAFRDFNNGAAVWMMAIWIGVGFIFQGVTATALAIDVPALPERGWYVFVGILTVIAAGYCVADQSIDAFRRFHAALHSHQAAETDYLVLAMSTGVSVPGY